MEFFSEHRISDLRWWINTSEHDGDRLASLSQPQNKKDNPQQYRQYLEDLSRFKNDWLG